MQPFEITSFSVIGLHGDTDIEIPIADNRLVIVGVNGLGKSTCLNIFCYFMSRQWHRLVDYDFKEVSLTIDGARLAIRKADISLDSSTLSVTRADLQRLAPRARNVLESILSSRPDLAVEFRRRNASVVAVRETLRLAGFNLLLDDVARFRRLLKPSLNPDATSPELLAVTQAIENAIGDARILYLPTYRRIEKDLTQILPDLEDELRTYRRQVSSETGTSYLELVEFGMEDVNRTIETRLTRLKDTARFQFGRLAQLYLRDVLQKRGDQFNPEVITALTDEEVDNILTRVDLGDDEATLREVITKIRNEQQLDESQRYVAHFFVQLHESRLALREDAVPITEFVTVCNKYLDGKHLFFDDVAYTLVVFNDKKKELQFSDLSSGEKQIISLFSQLYMEATASYLIVIDEPELSLSLEWQRDLLPDLEASGRCQFIAAATHSPYIFDNSFEPYSVDLSEFVKSHVVSG